MRADVSLILAIVAILAASSLLAACGGGSCPNDLPAACPTPSPSWSADVQPIVASRCTRCHTQGGAAGTVPLVTYDDVHVRRSAVLNQVYSCRMPQDGLLGADERAKLLGWLVCGAPDN